jgi:hypothetical protein
MNAFTGLECAEPPVSRQGRWLPFRAVRRHPGRIDRRGSHLYLMDSRFVTGQCSSSKGFLRPETSHLHSTASTGCLSTH